MTATAENPPGTRELLTRAVREIRDLRAELAATREAAHEPIAVLSLACRFPGGVETPDDLWNLLQAGGNPLSEIPPDRWSAAQYFDPEVGAPGKTICTKGCFIDGVDRFDADFFGITAREARHMDPQQRLVLELGWEAAERAGFAPSSLRDAQAGVFIGAMTHEYLERLCGIENIDMHTGTGNAPSIIAGRLAYVLGLQGPVMTVDTACSSSLVSVHLAVQNLRAGTCSLAFAGGVQVQISPRAAVAESCAHMLSRDGRCKTFDHAADGIGRGEGAALVLLKRLRDALRDGDPILAVIRGTAVNHDGRSSGLTVPNQTAQEKVLRAALADARLQSGEVSYVEAHGTGTPLGDPIEINALAAVFGERQVGDALLTGSLKTNFGHMEGAAGIGGLAKLILMVERGGIPPHLHLSTPNALIDWNDVSIRVPTEAMPWNSRGPRTGGVSAFGLSGTNAHVLVQEAPVRDPMPEPETASTIFKLSARSREAFVALAQRYQAYVAEAPDVSAVRICATAAYARDDHPHRRAWAIQDTAGLRSALKDAIASGPAHGIGEPRIGLLFSGQGSQYAGMGRGLYERLPEFRALLDEADRILVPVLDLPLTAVLYGDHGDRLDETAYTQPALFAIEYALGSIWLRAGIRPERLLGHSIGEYVAAALAGVFSFEEGLRLVAARGRLMQALPAGGGMLAVSTARSVAQRFVGASADLAIAAVNGPANCVIAGPVVELEALLDRFAAENISAVRLSVSHAFHSPAMMPMLDAYAAVLAEIRFQTPTLPVISNVTGAVASDELCSPDYWLSHVRQPVLYHEGMTSMARDCNVFIECGPHPVLLGMGRQCVDPDSAAWVPSLRRRADDLVCLQEAFAEVYGCGQNVAWAQAGVAPAATPCRLPTYAFQRLRYWLDASTARQPPIHHSGHPLLGERMESPALAAGTHLYRSVLEPGSLACISEHRVHGRTLMPTAAYIEMVTVAASQSFGDGQSLANIVIERPLVFAADRPTELQTILTESSDSVRRFQVSSREFGEGGDWTTHATGVVTVATSLGQARDLEKLRGEIADGLDVDAIYSRFAVEGIEYGESFRVLTRLYGAPGRALGELALPTHRVGEHAAYQVHPLLLDGCLQTIAGAFAQLTDDALFLPIGIDACQLAPESAGAGPLLCLVEVRASSAESRVVDLYLLRPDGRALVTCQGLRLRPASRERLQAAMVPLGLSNLLALEWVEEPLTAAAGATACDWILIEGERRTGRLVADALQDSGAAVACVAATDRLASVNDFGAALAEATRARTPGHTLRVVVMFDPADASPLQLESACRRLITIAQSLAGARLAGSVRLIVATGPAESATTDALDQGTKVSTALGLVRVLRMEYPQWSCAFVHLGSSVGASHMAVALAAASEGAEVATAYRGDRRHVLRLLPLKRATPRAPLRIPQGKTVLITGGNRGLGLHAAAWLVEQGAKHLALMSRGGERPEHRLQLASWRARGVSVTTLAVDVCDAQAVAGAIRTIDASGAPLGGIIHSAGVVHDGLLAKMSLEDFHRVADPKIRGAWNLCQATREHELDFIVFYSSISSLLGPPGQAGYAAANGYLDGLAHELALAGIPAMSINWGPWSEIGMAGRLDPVDRDRMRAAGLKFISPQEGDRLLAICLLAAPAQAVVLPLERVPSTWENGVAATPLFARLRPVSTTTGTADDLRQRLDAASQEKRRQLLVAHLRETIGAVLGQGSGAAIAGRERLFDLGFDSLLAMDLRKRLERSLRLNLSSTLAFDYPTLDALTEFLAAELGSSSSAPVAPPVADTPSSEILDSLSDDELATMLADRLQEMS